MAHSVLTLELLLLNLLWQNLPEGSAIISEGIHSAVDSGNSLLLLLGIIRSKKLADIGHSISFKTAMLMEELFENIYPLENRIKEKYPSIKKFYIEAKT